MNFVIENAVPKAITLNELEAGTVRDEMFQQIMTCVIDGRWKAIQKSPDARLRSFYSVRDELTIASNAKLLMIGSRIVIPSLLQERAVALAHEGHQGISKTKSLLREKVWFGGIDQMTETASKRYLACQAVTPRTVFEPLRMTQLPKEPWCELATDFYGPLPSGDYLSTRHHRRVLAFSNCQDCEMDISEHDNPSNCDIFATFGIPGILKSDNGPPFNSGQLQSYAEHMGFTHRKVTPYWPRANGDAERFMKNLGKIIRAA